MVYENENLKDNANTIGKDLPGVQPPGAQAGGLSHHIHDHKIRPDRLLTPHYFNPRLELIGRRVPSVLVSIEAYLHMCLYVELAQNEVGWMGTVARTESGDFLIGETFLLEQEVSATETELAAEDIGKLTMSLIDSGNNGLEKANQLRFWGHSHVYMPTAPSSTDESTMLRFGREGVPWYVRGIFNKYGHAQFTIYLFGEGLKISDAPWAVFEPKSGGADGRANGAPTCIRRSVHSLPGPVFESTKTTIVPSPELRQAVQTEFDSKVKLSPPPFWGWLDDLQAQRPNRQTTTIESQGSQQ